MSTAREHIPAPDIAWIEPGFAIGSCPYAGDRPRLARLGIQVIVALEAPDEWVADDWASLGVRLVAVPTPDWTSIPASCFDRVVEAIGKSLDSKEPVLLHCLAGVNRAPTLAAAVLCTRRGLTPEAAIQTVRRARPAAAPTPEQVASLKAWLRTRDRRSGADSQ